MHVAQLIQRGRITLVGGLAIPSQSLAVVLRNSAAIEIVVPQCELRLRVPRRGGRAKSVEVIVRRSCRRVSRCLYRCLCRRLSGRLSTDRDS